MEIAFTIFIILGVFGLIFAFVLIQYLEKTSEETSNPKKQTNQNVTKQQSEKHIEREIQKLILNLKEIGIKALTSLELKREEQEYLIFDVIDTLRENVPEREKELVGKIICESFEILLDKFSFDRVFQVEMSLFFDEFEKEIKQDGPISSYLLLNLISLVEKEKEKIKKMDSLGIPDTTFSINFAVKGLFYRSASERESAYSLKENDDLVLEKEPDNEYDPYAVKVLTTDGDHIGYVEKNKAKKISKSLGSLVECKVRKVIVYDDKLIYGVANFKERILNDNE